MNNKNWSIYLANKKVYFSPSFFPLDFFEKPQPEVMQKLFNWR